MRKAQALAVFLTLLLAVPFTALALSAAAYITSNLTEILAWVSSLSLATTISGRGWLMEMSARWPEVAGMVVGQVIILFILLIARQANLAEQQNNA